MILIADMTGAVFMLIAPVSFTGGCIMDNATEIKKARKEWNDLMWKRGILQALKRQGYDPAFVKNLEENFKLTRKRFIQKYGKYVEWL